MKRLLVCLSLLFVCTLLLTPASSFAQTTTATTATSEQSLQELVKEVRALRATLQRMNATVYRSQVMLEQLKFHREQVTRMERERRDARDQLNELQADELKLREMLKRAGGGVETGMISEKESASFKVELRANNRRQQQAMMRESLLSAELQTERGRLNELTDKLNQLLEREP